MNIFKILLKILCIFCISFLNSSVFCEASTNCNSSVKLDIEHDKENFWEIDCNEYNNDFSGLDNKCFGDSNPADNPNKGFWAQCEPLFKPGHCFLIFTYDEQFEPQRVVINSLIYGLTGAKIVILNSNQEVSLILERNSNEWISDNISINSTHFAESRRILFKLENGMTGYNALIVDSIEIILDCIGSESTTTTTTIETDKTTLNPAEYHVLENVEDMDGNIWTTNCNEMKENLSEIECLPDDYPENENSGFFTQCLEEVSNCYIFYKTPISSSFIPRSVSIRSIILNGDAIISASTFGETFLVIDDTSEEWDDIEDHIPDLEFQPREILFSIQNLYWNLSSAVIDRIIIKGSMSDQTSPTEFLQTTAIITTEISESTTLITESTTEITTIPTTESTTEITTIPTTESTTEITTIPTTESTTEITTIPTTMTTTGPTETTTEFSQPSTTELLSTTELPISTTMIPTTRTTNRPISTTTIEPYDCRQTGDFGELWEGYKGENATKNCSEINQIGVEMFWFCQENGLFVNRPNYLCEPEWIRNVEDNLKEDRELYNQSMPIDLIENYLNQIEDKLISVISNPSLDSDTYFGHHISRILKLVQDTVESLDRQENNLDNLENLSGKAIRTNAQVLTFEIPWGQLNQRERGLELTNLIKNFESTWYHLLLSRVEHEGNYYIKDLKLDEILLSTGLEVDTSSEKYIFPRNSNQDEESYMELPPDWTKYYNFDEATKYSCFQMPSKLLEKKFKINLVDNVEDLTKKHTLNGPLMSFSFLPLITEESQNGSIKIKFKHEGRASKTNFVGAGFSRENAKCVYWDPRNLQWSTDGCKLNEDESNGHFTVCECDHFTSFAILMGKQETDKTIVILTILFCSISNIFLALTIYILQFTKSMKNTAGNISKYIFIMLFIGNLLIILLNPVYFDEIPPIFCQTIGILMHFTFLSMWTWMGIMAWHLFRIINYPFEIHSGKFKFPFGHKIFGFGIPAIGTGAVAGVSKLSAYSDGSEDFCFLKGSWIWTFLGPISFIILLNLIILIASFVKVRKMKNSKKSLKIIQNDDQKTNLLGWIYLSISFGLNWIPGYFLFIDPTLISAYAFVILNSTQNMVNLKKDSLDQKKQRSMSTTTLNFFSTLKRK